MAFMSALDASYSTKIGYVLIFNLIVGTGALALPKAFHSAGCLLGVLLLLISAFMSYVCATFVVEGMAIANAAALRNNLRANKERSEKQLLAAYRIRKRVEMSGMARLFIGKYGVLFLNIIVAIYLFGDLAVYTVTVPKSFMNVICQSVNASTEHGHNACYDDWPNWLQRIAVYRFNVCVFVCFVTPLVLIGVHRTKFLQLSTSICRWTAFTLMIVLACIQLAREGSPSIPKMFNIHGFGSLFGTTVYAFMCHHSLPSLVTPMKSKRHIFIYLAMVYALVLIFYLALAITGTFSFNHIFDVYSLNFLHNKSDTLHELLVNYFLALFPVFTLSSNYPIVACTLINNLTVLVDLITELFFPDTRMELLGSSAIGFNPDYLTRRYMRKSNDSTCLLEDHSDSDDEIVVTDTISKIGRWRHYAIALIVITSATLIAFFTDNVLILTSITGSYPGVGVQYIIPSIIAIYGRRFSVQNIGAEVPHAVRSPFSSSLWPTAMLIWSAFTVLMVTLESCHVFTYLP